MKLIDVSSKSYPNKFAIIDDDDYDKVTKIKWCIFLPGYIISKGKNPIRMHRFILGVSKGQIIDHKNGNKKDNRKENLRICESVENSRNSKKPYTGKTSKYKGVSWDKSIGKFQTVINYGGKHRKIGVFKSQESAALAYNLMATILFGEFSRINKIF